MESSSEATVVALKVEEREGGRDGGSGGGGGGGGGDGTGCLGQTLLQMHNLQCAGDTAVVLGA